MTGRRQCRRRLADVRDAQRARAGVHDHACMIAALIAAFGS